MLVSRSYVVGEFLGYIGNEEYRLGDGSTWKVIVPIYLVRKKTAPPATVYRNEDRYFLDVKGMPGEVEVEPVYLPPVMLETPLRRPSNEELQQQLGVRTLTVQALEKWHRFVAIYEQSFK